MPTRPIPVGAQLYTLRDQLRNKKAIRKTLTQVAQIGYEYIQCSGFSFDAAWMKALCDELGLQVKLTHTPPERILNDTENVVAEHLLLGCPYVGIGGMPGERSADGARKFIKDYLPVTQKFQAAGLKLMYHNHSFEFERHGGERIWDILVNESDPALLGFTLDTYWVQHGGADVVDCIRRLAGRLDCVHYKDMAIVNGKQRFASIGSGNMNWPGIIAAFEEAGTKYAFIEQDDCYGADPLDELAASYKFLMGEKSYANDLTLVRQRAGYRHPGTDPADPRGHGRRARPPRPPRR